MPGGPRSIMIAWTCASVCRVSHRKRIRGLNLLYARKKVRNWPATSTPALSRNEAGASEVERSRDAESSGGRAGAESADTLQVASGKGSSLYIAVRD
jgi:hypothetical protein